MFTKFERTDDLRIVTLTEAKNQLNIIDNNELDKQIELLIHTVGELCEGATNRLLSRATVTLECSPYCGSKLMPFGEIDAMTSVEVDSTGIQYTFSNISQMLTIPEQGLDPSKNIIATFDAGYTKIPYALKQAALVLISDLFEHRESVIQGQFVDTPMSAKILLQRYKINKSYQ